MSEENEVKIYVPLRGAHVEPAPKFFSARWYSEQGRPVKSEKAWRLGRYKLAILWTGGSGLEINRKENFLRVWRLLAFWKRA